LYSQLHHGVLSINADKLQAWQHIGEAPAQVPYVPLWMFMAATDRPTTSWQQLTVQLQQL
jgi:hypothetical protein